MFHKEAKKIIGKIPIITSGNSITRGKKKTVVIIKIL